MRKLFSGDTRQRVREIIHEIKDGSFAAKLVAGQQRGHEKLKQMVAEKRQSAVTGAEQRLRRLIRFAD